MQDEDFKKIGDILETALTPVYEHLEGIDKKLERIENKQDAFTADMIQVQQELGSIQDNIKMIKDQNKRGLHEVREFVGMTTTPID